MLKGKSVIELTDMKTNIVERYEEENLVTNAVPDILRYNPMGLMYSVSNELITKFQEEIFPIANKCYGGILLFENTLDENPQNIFAPSDNPIIGYASNDVNSTDNPKRGSANLTESTPIQNGYKFVWDFSTSQANGKISSLALTHYRGGKHFYGDTHGKDAYLLLNRSYFFKDRDVSDSYNGCVEMDIENNSLISIWPKDKNSIEIVKVKESFSSIGLNDPIYTARNDAIERITIDTTDFMSKCAGRNEYGFFDGEDGYWYGFGRNSKKLIRIKINKTDYSTKTDEWSFDGITIPEIGSYYEKSKLNCHRYKNSCIKNGYLYILEQYNTDKIYKININNPVDISIIPLNRNINKSRFFGEYNYILNWGDYIVGAEFVLDKNDNATIRNQDTFEGRCPSYLMTEVKNMGPLMIGFGGYEEKFYNLLFLHTPYLGTINNLSTPILKTADKTMKITYTLTEES